MGRNIALLIAVFGVIGGLLYWSVRGDGKDDVPIAEIASDSGSSGSAGSHDMTGLTRQARADDVGSNEEQDAAAASAETGSGTLQALARELQERVARGETSAATTGGNTFEPGITSADIPITNGAHYFMVASESLTQDLIDLFTDKLLELEARAWTDPELQARWGEIQKILDLVRQGLQIGNAELPPVLSPYEELPYLARWRLIGRMFEMEASMLQAQGDYGAAAQSYLDTIAFANQFTLGGTLIGGLVGYAVTGFGMDGLQAQMRDGVIPPAEYAEIVAELERLAANSPTSEELQRYEAAVFDPWLAEQFESTADMRAFVDEQLRDIVLEDQWDDSLLSMSDAEFERVFNEYLQHRQFVVEYVARPIYEICPADFAMLENNPLSRMLIPPPTRLAEAEARVHAQLEGTALMAAIEAYAHENGVYPGALHALYPGFLSRPPAADPFSGAPFGYFSNGNNYVLYSVGYDLTDNGGVPSNNVRVPNTDIVLHGREAPPEPEEVLPPGGAIG